MQVVYDGGFDAVEVPAFNLFEVKRGEPVDVTDAEAEALCVSADWSYVEPVKDSKPSRKASDSTPADVAATPTDATPDAATTAEAAS